MSDVSLGETWLKNFCDEAGPAGLMACAEPGAVVAVEVFVEEDVVAPVGIGLELFRAAVDGSPAVWCGEPDGDEPVGEVAIARRGQLPAGAGRGIRW